MKRINRDSDTRLSLANFKLKAEAVNVEASIHQITGGTLEACHTGQVELQ
jgi:hypothetical protein